VGLSQAPASRKRAPGPMKRRAYRKCFLGRLRPDFGGHHGCAAAQDAWSLLRSRTTVATGLHQFGKRDHPISRCFQIR